MADKAADGLPYGQFGLASYEVDESKWNFQREISTDTALYCVGNPQMISTARPDEAGTKFRGRGADGPSRRREKQTKALTQALPELQPTADILSELARVSEAVENAVSQHDSTIGQLITLGKIYDESKRAHVPAVAFPSGPTGSNVRIVLGLRQRQGWDEHRTSWFESLSFTGEETTWTGPGVSILSIIFAQPVTPGEHYLAVQLQTETLIFRPVLRKRAVHGNTRLEANLIFSIGINQTGGFPHAHLAFNPWFTGQLSIVDRAGSWTIWETGRKSNKPNKISAGSLPDRELERANPAFDDGWARVSWVENSSTLCIANRRTLVLVDLDDSNGDSPVVVDVGLRKNYGCLLDVVTFQPSSSCICVLTSNHIVLSGVSRSAGQQPQTKVLARLRHHRNPDDVSLRITLGVDIDQLLLVLWSAFNSAVDQYWLHMSSAENIQFQQPNALALPADLRTSFVREFQVKPAASVESEGDGGGTSKPAAWQVYVLGKDRTLTQSLYTSDVHSSLVHGPTWTKLISKVSTKSDTGPTGVLPRDLLDSVSTCHPPKSAYITRRRRQPESRVGDEWTISYNRVIRALESMQTGEATVDVDEVVEEVNAMLRQPEHELLSPMRSLREIADAQVGVADIAGASTRLANVQVSQAQVFGKPETAETIDDSQARGVKVLPLSPTTTLGTFGLSSLDTLEEAVETLRESWTTPMSNQPTQATLAAMNKRLKSIAADVVLASKILRVVDAEPSLVEAPQAQSQSWDLPVRPTPQDEEFEKGQLRVGSPQNSRPSSLPTPSASASTVTGSSYQSNLAAPEISRLRKFTSFSKDAPSALPRALNKVLTHWNVGSDPADYDWRSAARQVSHREEAEDDEMTEKERRQMQRRTERYMRRQRKEAEESQRMQMLSSQAPEIMSASQPARAQHARRVESQASAAAVVGSSQSYGPSQITASQVVPGRHGGRPPPKKKRKSGF